MQVAGCRLQVAKHLNGFGLQSSLMHQLSALKDAVINQQVSTEHHQLGLLKRKSIIAWLAFRPFACRMPLPQP
ncbi:hypothetical protein Q427_23125 [Halomonas sp. BC04]|nr:hypothetical protein Q427_23125 [Halomonas sp. BC04]